MEKKEIKNVDTSNGIYTENVCIGVVSLIKVADKDENTKGSVIDQSTTKKVVALDIRKIAFSANYGAGKDLFYSLSRNNPYCYEYIDNNDFVNNTLVIRKKDDIKLITIVITFIPFFLISFIIDTIFLFFFISTNPFL